jgi:hypothetical protein
VTVTVSVTAGAVSTVCGVGRVAGGGLGDRHGLRHRRRGLCHRRRGLCHVSVSVTAGAAGAVPRRQRNTGEGDGARPGPDRLAVAAT